MSRKSWHREHSGLEAGLPDRQAVLSFIAENPDRASKRDIARAFHVKGAARAELKSMLRDMEDEGLLERKRKRLVQPGTLPHVTMLDIRERDADGGLIARPAEWDHEHGDPPVVAIARRKAATKEPVAGIGDRVLAKIFPSRDKSGPDYTARIIKIFDRRRNLVLGVVRQRGDGSLRLEPVEIRQPELMVDSDFSGEAKPGDLVEAEPVRQGRYGLARAKVVTVVGNVASEKAISMIAIHAHGIPHIFPAEALKEAEAAQPAGMKDREDWRDLPLVTIDPADARDHDDAVHAEADTDERNPGGHIITVAIADVAAYILPGSALDREAQKRGNSVYFPDRVVPMLPERISNNLCSLREDEDRPALAARMTISASGKKIRHSFHRIMMRSAGKLAYPQAQAAIDGQADDKTGPLLEGVLEPLWKAYRALRMAREAREPLDLDLPERKLLLKPDGTIDRVIIPERLDAHRLIEEYMILANVCAAETLEQKKQPFVYRIHDAPSLAKQESLREFLKTIGISLARGAQLRPSSFNGILKRVDGTDNDVLVNEVVLRSQSQAEYAPVNIGHFGLNLRRYAHFTSPIRRYADLIVHRALIAALNLGQGAITHVEELRLEEVAALISGAERRAMKAERETVDRLVASYLANRINDSFDAKISGVTKAGLFVQLPQFGADGFIPISSLEGDYYHFDETAHALSGDRTGLGYRLGDTVTVRLVEVAPLAGAMRFEMLSEPAPVPGASKSFHKGKTRMARRRQRSGTGKRKTGNLQR